MRYNPCFIDVQFLFKFQLCNPIDERKYAPLGWLFCQQEIFKCDDDAGLQTWARAQAPNATMGEMQDLLEEFEESFAGRGKRVY